MSDVGYICQQLRGALSEEQKATLRQRCAHAAARGGGGALWCGAGAGLLRGGTGRKAHAALRPPLLTAHRLRPRSPSPLCARSCAEADGAGSGFVSYAAFQGALAAASVEMQDQALITVMRKWHAADGKEPTIEYKGFLEQLG